MPALLILGIPAGIAMLGFAADKTGEGIDSASNGVIKLAVAGVVGYVVLKKMRIL